MQARFGGDLAGRARADGAVLGVTGQWALGSSMHGVGEDVARGKAEVQARLSPSPGPPLPPE